MSDSGQWPVVSGQWLVAGGQWRTPAEQSAAARRLLADLLGETVDVEHDAHGAPYLPARPDLHISLSHCRTAVAVAVSGEGPVGIDVECRRKVSPSLMQRVCTPEELDVIQRSADSTMEFLRFWTRKEAVLKCRGTGIKGFGSMVQALSEPHIEVRELSCSIPDTVVALAVLERPKKS